MSEQREPTPPSHSVALRSAFFLVLLSICCGLGSNQLRTRPLSLSRPVTALAEGDIGLLEARQKLADPEYVFLDTRPRTFYQKGHLPGALSLPIREFSQVYPELEPRLTNKTLVVYCGGPRCPKAEIVRGYLESKGHKGVRLFRIGITGWAEEGLPVIE